MSLSEKVRTLKKEVITDSYSMSIGELINLYRDDELDIHPKFQRLFRWSDFQKTRFIESILLNIPLPSIFVSQNEDGVWDVVDGVQRLSTIFQFVGILKDFDGKQVEPFKLQKTKTIPELENVVWDSTKTNGFSKDLQIDFKRTKISINIVTRGSDSSAKYELFQRLNTGGTQLSDQEVRNCLIIMSNSSFFNKLAELSNLPSFINTTPLSDRKLDEQYRMDLICRYFVGMYSDLNSLKTNYSDINNLLDEEIVTICLDKEFDIEQACENFKNIFTLLNQVIGENAFKRYKKEFDKFSGAVLTSAFQVITIGLAKNLEHLVDLDNSIVLQKIKDIYESDEFEKMLSQGVQPIERFINLSKFGEDFFSE